MSNCTAGASFRPDRRDSWRISIVPSGTLRPVRRLLETPSGIEHNIPVGSLVGILGHIIGQQVLREV